MPFPLASPPSGFAACSFTGNHRNGLFYVGDTVTVTLSQAGATSYEVRDYDGNILSSGAASGTSVSPAAPVGGWDPGWYRLYLKVDTDDATWGFSRGGTAFGIIRDDARFPPIPDAGYGYGFGGGEAQDAVGKGVLGIGTTRSQIIDANNAGVPNIDRISQCITRAAYQRDYWTDPAHAAYADANRSRYNFIQFPNRTTDRIEYTAGNPGFRVFVKDETVDGSQVFLQVETGSVSGKKYTVRSPDSATIVETYDNIADAPAAITAMAASAYVAAFGGAGANPANQGPTAIGNAYRDGVILTAQSLYPEGFTHYEGPLNEGTLNVELVHRMRLFQAAVHTGHASAKAIGPCPIEISDNWLEGNYSWETFLAAGGGDYCDEISFHAYNSQTNGDINLGRYVIEGFQAKLAEHGQENKLLWCTESTHVFTSVYGWHVDHNNGIYHPRRSRVPLLQTLLWEQYGLPRERNLVWYDNQHGFWSYPAWLFTNTDKAVVPYAVLYRTLAEETFEMEHSQTLDFGNDAANAIFLGSVYQEPSGPGCAVLVTHSYMPDTTVTLQVTGTASPLTVVDAWGNESTVNISGGLATVGVREIPTYVQLPTGVSVSVYSVNDWGPGVRTNVASAATTTTVGGVSAPEIADAGFLTNYALRAGVFISSGTLPETAEAIWGESKTVDRVVVWSGFAWQDSAALVDFDVDTWDGATWTTRKTVTTTSPTSFLHGTDSTNAGTKRETYWDEQWIFDVGLDDPVACEGVRLNVRETSYGGEPDADAIDAGGQGSTTQRVVIQEIMALEALEGGSEGGSAFSRPGVAGGSGGSAFLRYGGV